MEKTKTVSMRVLNFATAAVLTAAMCIGSMPATMQKTTASAAGGLHTSGTKVLDGNGNEVVMRGINTIQAWGIGGSVEKSIRNIASLGSNAVRIAIGDGAGSFDGQRDWPKTDAGTLQSMIDICRQEGMICVLNVHNPTGSNNQSDLDGAVNYWKEVKDIVNANKDMTIVNIANEWAGEWNTDNWKNGYVSAVKSLRDAGIENLLMVDCAGWGQFPKCIWEGGSDVINADSMNNIMFSIHMYEYAGSAGTNKGDIKTIDQDDADAVKYNIDQALGMGVPLCIGEFGCDHTDGAVDEDTIMSYSQQKGVSWLAWSWAGNGDIWKMLDISYSCDDIQLTSWGDRVVNGADGIKATSKKASIFTGENPNPVDSSSTVNPSSKPDSSSSTNVGDGKLIATYKATDSTNVYIPYDVVSAYDEISFRIVPLNPTSPPIGKCDNGCIGYNERANGGWNSSMEFCLDGATDYPQGVTTGVKTFAGKTLSIKKGEFFPGCDNGGDAAFAIQYWGSYDGIQVEVYAGGEPTPGPIDSSSVAPTPTPDSSKADSSSQVNPTPTPSGSGFHTSGTKVLDANGNEFVMRGINSIWCWDCPLPGESDAKGYDFYATLDPIAKTGANCVRVAVGMGSYKKASASDIQKIIDECKARNMICILEVHDITGSGEKDDLIKCANYWAGLADVLSKNKDYAILNIANEWCGSWNETQWANGYKKAIPILRDAGIDNLLMVDAAGWGQDAACIAQTGKDILAADSMNNTMFSIHMYEYAGGGGADDWDATDNRAEVTARMDDALSVGAPLVIGEFADQHAHGDVDEYGIMEHCEKKGIGYIGWSWIGNRQCGPNGSDETDYIDIVKDYAGTQLTTFGEKLINGEYGIKNTSKICSVFTNPPTPVDSSSTVVSKPDSSTAPISKPDSSKQDDTSSTTPTPVSGKGDVDGNGKIDSADALTVLKNVVGLPTTFILDNADTNGDGTINTLDALEILKYVVGLPNKIGTVNPTPTPSSSTAPVNSSKTDPVTSSIPDSSSEGKKEDATIDPGLLTELKGWDTCVNGDVEKKPKATAVTNADGTITMTGLAAETDKDACLGTVETGGLDWSKVESFSVVVFNHGATPVQINPILKIGANWAWTEVGYKEIPANQAGVISFDLEDAKFSDGGTVADLADVEGFFLRFQGKSSGDVQVLSVQTDLDKTTIAKQLAELNRPTSFASGLSSLTQPYNNKITYKDFDATAGVTFDKATDTITFKMNNADGDKYAGCQFETCPGMGTGLDYSAYKTVTMDVENLTGSTVELTMLWQTGGGWLWQECPAVAKGATGIAKIPAGYKGQVTFNVAEPTWKSEESNWEYTELPVDLDITKCVAFKIYGDVAPVSGEFKMSNYECHF